jgi:hypothetical protein
MLVTRPWYHNAEKHCRRGHSALSLSLLTKRQPAHGWYMVGAWYVYADSFQARIPLPRSGRDLSAYTPQWCKPPR